MPELFFLFKIFTLRPRIFSNLSCVLRILVSIVLTILPPYFGLQGISKEGAGFLTIVDRVIKLIMYYGHERAWFTSNWGVVTTEKD